jgi:hypothetical protein
VLSLPTFPCHSAFTSVCVLEFHEWQNQFPTTPPNLKHVTCAYSYDFIFNTSAQTTIPSRLIHTSGLCKPPLVCCCYLMTPHSFPLQNRLSKQRQDITSIQIGSQADTSTSMFQFRFQTHVSHLIPAFQPSCTGHDHHTSS